MKPAAMLAIGIGLLLGSFSSSGNGSSSVCSAFLVPAVGRGGQLGLASTACDKGQRPQGAMKQQNVQLSSSGIGAEQQQQEENGEEDTNSFLSNRDPEIASMKLVFSPVYE